MDGGAITVRPGFGRGEPCRDEVGRRKGFGHDADPDLDPHASQPANFIKTESEPLLDAD